MLSERGLQIVEKLIENNQRPITSKTLAMYLGVSERSVKTYIKEVSDFCMEYDMHLSRTPGIGFVANFTKEQIEKVNQLKKEKKTVMSKKQRMSYIMYILLSGWETYTLSLFSDELNVSKKIISDDIHSISEELGKYNLRIHRVAGHGVFISGDEFSIRKALKSYCGYEIGNKTVEQPYDYRISIGETELWVNNFGQDNFEKAVETIYQIENNYEVVYTDYAFKMLVQYLSIQLFRIRMGSTMSETVSFAYQPMTNPFILSTAKEKLEELGRVQINEFELQYLDVLFAAAALQSSENQFCTMIGKDWEQYNREICVEMLKYLSEILNANLEDNELLRKSLEAFVPASIIRTQYGIEVTNPFMEDVREMYSGVFAICFTLSKFYVRYSGEVPTDHEISFLALFLGGAMHRSIKTVKAVLIGTSGIAAANIVAKKITNKIEDIEIVAILSSEKIGQLEDYDFDIILSMLSDFKYEDKVVHISPIISKRDEKNIHDKCFEILSNPAVPKEKFSGLIDKNHILFLSGKVEKETVIKEACRILFEQGYVKKDYYQDVMHREKIEPTSIGNGVAIPHGMPENVCEPKVFVIRLEHPLNWGNRMVDLVFLLALNFDNVETTKAFFHDFSKMIGMEEKLKCIRETTDAAMMEKVLKEQLYWN